MNIEQILNDPSRVPESIPMQVADYEALDRLGDIREETTDLQFAEFKIKHILPEYYAKWDKLERERKCNFVFLAELIEKKGLNETKKFVSKLRSKETGFHQLKNDASVYDIFTSPD